MATWKCIVVVDKTSPEQDIVFFGKTIFVIVVLLANLKWASSAAVLIDSVLPAYCRYSLIYECLSHPQPLFPVIVINPLNGKRNQVWHSSCMFNCEDIKKGENMRQRTGNITEPRQSGFMKQSLRKCFYLLKRSLERYGYLKEVGAPDIFIAQEKALIRRQLLFLFNLREKLV